jgi:hypothetical protein
LRLGPTTAQLHFDAAGLFALAASKGLNPAKNFGRSSRELEKALAGGADPDQVKIDPALEGLRRRLGPRRWGRLLARAAPGQQPPPIIRVVDPLADLSP